MGHHTSWRQLARREGLKIVMAAFVLCAAILLTRPESRLRQIDPKLVVEQCTTTPRSFEDAGGLTLNGNAALVGPVNSKVLRVTPAVPSQAGSAFTTQKLSLLNGGSFSTAFSFQFSSQFNGGADGVVFAIQNVANNVGGAGGGIGFLNINPSIGIEFDNWFNSGADPDANHVGVDINGSVASVQTANLDGVFQLDDGAVHYTWIDYNGATDLLEVRVAATNTRPATPILSRPNVDIPGILGGADAFVGFTSGTGAAHANHDILEWSMANCYRPVGVDSPPFVDAGGPYAGAATTPVAILGGASDDVGVASTAWTYNGPVGATCAFGSAAALSTTVTCNQQGNYVLTLTGTDTAAQTASDTATLTLTAPPEPIPACADGAPVPRGYRLVQGTPGNDYLRVFNGSVVIRGGEGNDTIAAGAGNQILCGNGGNDKISAGSGDDAVSGGDGDDWLFGDSGDDTLYGGKGDDNLNGGTGRDRGIDADAGTQRNSIERNT